MMVWMVTEKIVRVEDKRTLAEVDEPLVPMLTMFTDRLAALRYALRVNEQNPVTDWFDGCNVWISATVDNVDVTPQGDVIPMFDTLAD